jgi:sugar/nucleoside kinase (ribokinase family)
MSKHLADLLGNDHPLFRLNLKELERSTGNAGIDAKLLADTIEIAHSVMREIGLDPSDTSAEELYHALNSLVASQRANEVLGISSFVVLNVDEALLSFNLYDVIENAHHELAFADRQIDHAQRHLRAEIIRRYAEHEKTDKETVHDLTKQANIHTEEDQGYQEVDQALNQASNTSSTPSILMIGDIFTDAFIKLNENYAVVESDADGKEWLKLPFGSKPPYEHVDIVESVGPSPNAAISCARLGLDVSLMAWLGDDEPGKSSLAHLKSEKVRTDNMITEQGKKSSYWYVLRHGTDRTMLVKSEPYTYTWQDPITVPDWIYLAYIGEDSWHVHEGLADYLDRNPSVKFVFQPATYHFEWGTEKLAALYAHSYMVVMNREEAQQVTDKSHDDLQGLADGLHELGPNIVVITDGSHGSYASHDGKLLTIPNYPDPKPPTDRTGAGDAFASTLTAALMLGKSIDEALTWAPINSAGVVQELGAQRGLMTMSTLQEWLANAPEDYKVTEVM